MTDAEVNIKAAYRVVWEGGQAQSCHLHPISPSFRLLGFPSGIHILKVLDDGD
jgi:hypothetical protein